ncbi:hypothetical protein R1flu_011396 [Riccia fluitans]|uniref:Uncharacterized protein n=1 Tax=Riccia fluitans TaxID=41844 RepID=A0ABD1Z8U5_9MARC
MIPSDPAQSSWRAWTIDRAENCWSVTVLAEFLRRNQYEPRVLSVSSAGYRVGRYTYEDLLGKCLLQELVCGTGNVGQKYGVPVILLGADLGGVWLRGFVVTAIETETLNSKCEEAFPGSQPRLRRFLHNLKALYIGKPSGAGVYDSDIGGRLVTQMIHWDRDNEMLRLMRSLQRTANGISCKFEAYVCDKESTSEDPSPSRHKGLCYIKVASDRFEGFEESYLHHSLRSDERGVQAFCNHLLNLIWMNVWRPSWLDISWVEN